MADDTWSAARYAALKWNCPLSQAHGDDLLSHLRLDEAQSLVDLGCGWGELALQAASRMTSSPAAAANGLLGPSTTITGIDSDKSLIDRAISLARDRSIENATFIEGSAETWTGKVDRAICIGSSHTLGGTATMFQRLAELVPHGGRALVGDTCWEKPTGPREETSAMFDEVSQLSDVVAAARDAGWLVLHLSTADQREWDDFESRHRAGYREWVITNRDDPRAQEIIDKQDEREKQYLQTYRGELGFVYLVLGR